MKIQQKISLKPYNTFAIDVLAEKFASVETECELKLLLQQSVQEKLPVFILGGGSNILFTKNIKGLVLKIGLKGIDIEKQNEKHVWVKVKAGEKWQDFVEWCLKNDYGGLENLSLIPGNVGAAPIQNIGAYGVEQKDCFSRLEAYDVENQKVVRFNKKRCGFGYRNSLFKKEKGKFVISSVIYKLTKKNHRLFLDYGSIQSELKSAGIFHPAIQDISKTIIKIRESKLPDPEKIGNSGSFFKNPEIDISHLAKLKRKYPKIKNYPVSEKKVKVPAGWLIEKANWKGKRFGAAGVYEKQSLVLVNYGDATGKEIFDLSENILQDVHQKFGILLEREVNVL